MGGSWQFLILQIITGVFFFAQPSLLCAQQDFQGLEHLFTTPRNYSIYRTADRMTMDGRDEEPSWKRAPWSAYFVDIEGDANPKPQHNTRFKMLWDDDHLYLYAVLEEPHVWAKLTQHDQIVFHDNDFEIFIDPDDDAHRYFEIEVNALGTIFDLYLPKPYRDRNKAVISWDARNLKTGISIEGTINNPLDTDKHWAVEMAIPFSSLKQDDYAVPKPSDGTIWRMNFSRVQWDTEVIDNTYEKKIHSATNKPFPEHNWVWSPQGIINMHYPERWGYVLFSTEKDGSKPVSFNMPASEAMKKYLWLVYYKQSAYRKENGHFSNDLQSFSIMPSFVNENGRSCTISLKTSDTYNAMIRCEGTEETWTISHDGQILKVSTD